MLDNLLDNAIRHAPEGSTVTVDVQPAGDEILCAVTDRGPGIPAKHLPLIFERFYRVDSSRARHSGGSGLGLAIVHSLLTAQDGRISIDSVEGQGTTITFRFQSSWMVVSLTIESANILKQAIGCLMR